MPQCWPTVHWVLLLGTVQEEGPADASPHYREEPANALPAWRGSACNQLACLTPAHPIIDIFVHTGGARGGGARGGAGGSKSLRDGRSGGRNKDSRGEMISKEGVEKRKMTATATTAAWASRRRHKPKS